MCEPNHSIVAYPDNDDKGPTAPRVENIPEAKTGILTRIKRWFFLSKMGFGHSEAVGAVSPFARQQVMPADTRYEARWWERQVILDGSFNALSLDYFESRKLARTDIYTDYSKRVSPWDLLPYSGPSYSALQAMYEEEKQAALEAAAEYARRVSIGNMSIFRRFLETSMLKTLRPHLYVEAFMRMCLPAGRDALTAKLSHIVSERSKTLMLNKEQLHQTVRAVLGITRKRHLLVPEWADDPAVWGQLAPAH